jgi:hypothetical protein
MSSVLNAQSTCQAINARIQQAAENKSKDGMFATFTDPASMWRNKTDSQINNTNVQYLDLSSKDIVNISNSCSNIATGSQSNVISQDPSCLAAAYAICNTFNNDSAKLKCLQQQQKAVEINKVTQSNVADVKLSCQMNNFIKKLSEKKVSVENAAAVVAAQKASGLGSQASSTTSNCNEVRTDMSSEDYTTLIMQCANNIAVDQLNSFNACNGNGVSQSNNVDLMNSCLAENKVFSEQKTSTDTKSSFSAKVDQKSDMLGLGDLFSSPTKMIISAVIILILFCASYFAYTKAQEAADG